MKTIELTQEYGRRVESSATSNCDPLIGASLEKIKQLEAQLSEAKASQPAPRTRSSPRDNSAQVVEIMTEEVRL